MKIQMKNPKTREIKDIKVGWNWILFLFSGVLGIPLFLRKLYVLGGIFLVVWIIINLTRPTNTDFLTNSDEVLIWYSPAVLLPLALQIWLGIEGSELTAKNYLEKGWVFVDPESDAVKHAKIRWKISTD